VGGTINVIAYDETAGDATLGLSSASFAINTTTNPIASAAFSDADIHGQVALTITLTSPISIQYTGAPAPVSTTTFSVQLGSLKDNEATPQPLYAMTGNFTKAGWNYFLIQGDQSGGLHNPSFVTAVLNNTAAQDLSF
jgi:hypothetical protein